jgi:hypothetical protein
VCAMSVAKEIPLFRTLISVSKRIAEKQCVSNHLIVKGAFER